MIEPLLVIIFMLLSMLAGYVLGHRRTIYNCNNDLEDEGINYRFKTDL